VIALGFGLVLPRLRNSDQPNIDLDAWSEETSTLRSKVAEIESHWKAKNETETEKRTEAFFRVNINVANEEELIKLPGIGPELAERILEYRNKNGGFFAIEDLSNVKGIGTKKIKKIRPFVVLN
jgi:comEA protein